MKRHSCSRRNDEIIRFQNYLYILKILYIGIMKPTPRIFILSIIFLQLFFLILNLSAKSLASKCTFQVTYTGFPLAAKNAFDYATSIWSSALYSDVPIKINVYFIAIPGSILGSTIPNGAKDFSGAPYASTWYPS